MCNFRKENKEADGNVGGKIVIENPQKYDFAIVQKFSEIPEKVENFF